MSDYGKTAIKMIKRTDKLSENHRNLCHQEGSSKIGSDLNSILKADPDATFMRMKDDSMKNGHFKPAYNI